MTNHGKCLFGKNYFCQLILLLSLFLLLFMGSIVLFGIIHRSYCTILATFYPYLQYFFSKKFSVSTKWFYPFLPWEERKMMKKETCCKRSQFLAHNLSNRATCIFCFLRESSPSPRCPSLFAKRVMEMG